MLPTVHGDSFLTIPGEIYSTNLVGIRFRSSNSKPRGHSHCCLDVLCTPCRRVVWCRCRRDIERQTAPHSGIQNIESFRIIVLLSGKRNPHPFRVSFDLGITGPGGHGGFVVTLAIPTGDRSCVGLSYWSTVWTRWSGAYSIT